MDKINPQRVPLWPEITKVIPSSQITQAKAMKSGEEEEAELSAEERKYVELLRANLKAENSADLEKFVREMKEKIRRRLAEGGSGKDGESRNGEGIGNGSGDVDDGQQLTGHHQTCPPRWKSRSWLARRFGCLCKHAFSILLSNKEDVSSYIFSATLCSGC